MKGSGRSGKCGERAVKVRGSVNQEPLKARAGSSKAVEGQGQCSGKAVQGQGSRAGGQRLRTNSVRLTAVEGSGRQLKGRQVKGSAVSGHRQCSARSQAVQ